MTGTLSNTKLLVQRQRGTSDRRVVRVRITPEGQRRCESLYPAVERLHASQFPGASEEELRELERILRSAEEAAKAAR